MGDFRIEDMMMRYSVFVPRLFNLCLSLGFEPGLIMPSRAFCSDESQGFPIILLTKHFGVFPFNHGMVGGIVATDRHGPHAHHGKDMVIIQASHVGYDPEEKRFGVYRRLQTTDHEMSSDCGKICGVCDWYINEYRFAQNNIFLTRENGQQLVMVDNQLLNTQREEGLFLYLDALLYRPDGERTEPLRVYSTAKAYRPNPGLLDRVPADFWIENKPQPIGEWLTPDLFQFKRAIPEQEEGQDHLEKNLVPAMPVIVTSKNLALDAAKYNTMIEFDRTFRTIMRSEVYRGKNLLFISGLNIDISPNPDQVFPLTKFVPWAAFIQTPDGQHRTLEQRELVEQLKAQSTDNPHQIELDAAIRTMGEAAEIPIHIN